MTPIKLSDGWYGRTLCGEVFGPFRALDPGGAYAYQAGGKGWTQDGRHDLTGADSRHDIVAVGATIPELRRAA